MAQCKAFIRGSDRCPNEAVKGYSFCEEHKTRPAALREQESKADARINNVIDANDVFQGELVEPTSTEVQKKEYDNAPIPRHQQNIFQKAAATLEKALDWAESAEQKVGDLNGAWRYQDQHGVEQLRSEIPIYERAQDRVIRAVTALAKLDIEAQNVNVNNLIKDMIKGVVTNVFTRMEMSPEEIARARTYLAEEFEKLDRQRQSA